MQRNARRHPRATRRVSWLTPLFGLLALLLGGSVIFSHAQPAHAVARTWSLSATNYSGPEGSEITITFQRTGGSNETDGSVELTFTSGSAQPGVDYLNPSNGDITVVVGDANSGTFDLQTFANASGADKTLTVEISAVGGDDIVGTQDTATITIEDVNSPAPVVTGISPRTGPVAGGTSVTITGQNFVGATCASVKFGALSAPSGCSISSTEITATSPAVVSPQTVHVTVTTAAGGTSAESDDDEFTYTNTPRVTNVSPRQGPMSGGNTVTLTGTGFNATDNQNTVEFDGVNATILTASTTVITVTAPSSGIPKTVNITVTNASGTSPETEDDEYTYVNEDAPNITNISPSSGSTLGGATVTITGTKLRNTTSPGDPTVTFDGIEANIVSSSATTVIVTAPAHGAGSVDVKVITNQGADSVEDGFTYTTGPTIASLEPSLGPTLGGNSVLIRGTGFPTSGTKPTIKFGGNTVPLADITLDTSTRLTAKAPAGNAGTVRVSLETSEGTTPDTSADDYAYSDGFPTITSLEPNSGPAAGGNEVLIKGTNFPTNGTKPTIKFGSATVPSGDITFDTVNQIKAKAPAGTAGNTVSVSIETAQGTSPGTSNDDYTYTTGPAVTNVSPSSGPSGQVTFVTITGSGFSSNSCIVKFGDVTAVANRDAATPTTKYDAITPTSIGPGTVDVRVTCGSQTSPISSAAKFTFTAQGAAPTITSLSPSSGAASTANIEVTINGTNLGGALSVTFGGTNASIVANSNTATQIKVIAPAKTAGKVEVVVTTAGGSNNTANDANDFTYVNANLPTVTGLSPNTGPINSSSISVTITGTNFNGATEVKFDNVLVTSFSQPNSTTIVVTAPLRATTGTVQVTVKTPEGTSSTDGTGNDFSYTSGPTTTTLTLFFRWTLVAWAGKDNMTVQDALKGLESPDVPATNNILASVSVIYRWSPDGVGCPSGTSQCWLANFPNAGNVPGANDFTTLRTTFVYWIAVLSQVQWTVLQGP